MKSVRQKREREFERESSRKREREKEREIKKKKKERRKERMESWKNDQMCWRTAKVMIGFWLVTYTGKESNLITVSPVVDSALKFRGKLNFGLVRKQGKVPKVIITIATYQLKIIPINRNKDVLINRNERSIINSLLRVDCCIWDLPLSCLCFSFVWLNSNGIGHAITVVWFTWKT